MRKLDKSIEHVHIVLKALSDPTRLRILKLLSDHGTLCVCEVMQALNISETRASRNLGILGDVGLLRSERVGQWVHYSLETSVSPWTQAISRLLSESIEDDPEVAQDRIRFKQAVKLGSTCSTSTS